MACCYIDICRIILASTIGGEHTIPQISTSEFVTCKILDRTKYCRKDKRFTNSDSTQMKQSDSQLLEFIKFPMYFCCKCSKIVSGVESSSDALSRQEADGTLPTLSHCNLLSFDTKVMRPQVPHHAHGN